VVPAASGWQRLSVVCKKGANVVIADLPGAANEQLARDLDARFTGAACLWRRM
jgi:hypothetical protein